MSNVDEAILTTPVQLFSHSVFLPLLLSPKRNEETSPNMAVIFDQIPNGFPRTGPG